MNQFDQRFAYVAGIVRRHDARKSFPGAGTAPSRAANDRLVAVANDRATSSPFIVAQVDKLFIPFGNFPHAKGLQKFDRASAEILRANFGRIDISAGRPHSPGVPIYRGHPDVPGRADSNPAAPACGWVQDIQIEAGGVSLLVKWSPEGEAEIRNGNYRFYSPHWELRRVSGGIQPVRLISIGLTNSPAIAVPAIANDRLVLAQRAKMRAANDAEQLRANERRTTLASVGAQYPRLDYAARWQIATNRRPDLFAQ